MSEKVAGYGRVSTLGQMDGTSFEEQKRIITEECEQKGWELAHFYSDEGYSGKNSKRPGFVELLNDAKKGTFQTVMFTKLDRFGRSMRDILNSLNDLHDLGIRIFCINQPEINSEGVYGKLLMQLLGAFAEFEHTMISERTKQGRNAAWKNKKFMGRPPFGYKIDKENGNKIVIDEEKAAIYNRIVSMYLDQRMNTGAIALQLNSEKIPPPGNKGKKRWLYLPILWMLKNSAYTGTAIYNKNKTVLKTKEDGKQYYFRGKELNDEDDWMTIHFPPLITQDRFDEIQARIKKNTKFPLRKFKEYEDHFLLERGLLYCGECGSRMNRHLKEAKSKDRFQYVCYWKNHKQQREMSAHKMCNMSIDAEKTDTYVLYEIFNFLSNPLKFAETWYKDLNLDELKGNITRLTKEKETEEKVVRRLYDNFSVAGDDILQSVINEHKVRKDEIVTELKRLQLEYDFGKNKFDRFEEFEKAYTNSSLREKISTYYNTQKQFIDFLDKLSFEQKQKIVEAVVSPENGGRIIAYEGVEGVEIEIDFRADLNRIENLIGSFEDRKELLGYDKNVEYSMELAIIPHAHFRP
jgi:site-specific DNA recombinase